MRVKWRMISISLTSGMLPRSFLSEEPRSFAVSTSGTSSGGSFHAALPGEDFSKIKPSFWLTWRVALRMIGFIAPPPRRFLPSGRAVSPQYQRANPPPCRSQRAWSIPCSTTEPHFRARDKTSSAAGRRLFCVPTAAVEGMRIFAGLYYKLAETGRGSEQNLTVPGEFSGRIRRLRQVLLGQFFQSDLTVDRHEDVDHERNQGLVGANVRGRFLAADVLLASCEREHESSTAL